MLALHAASDGARGLRLVFERPLAVLGCVALILIVSGGLRAGHCQEPSSQPPASADSGTPQPNQQVPQRIRASAGVTSGLVIKKVSPKYPNKARKQHIQGTVVLMATISKDGNITDLKMVSGHPMLVDAAITAVKKWKYRPYLLQGHPVEVETQVLVNFTLAGK